MGLWMKDKLQMWISWEFWFNQVGDICPIVIWTFEEVFCRHSDMYEFIARPELKLT